MKTIWEKGDDDDGCGGGCRTSALLAETQGGENGRMLEVVGGTKSMRIAGEEECNSSSSSSIGNDSDDDREGDVEYDHPNNNGSFDDAIQALEEALPIRRGISSFYNGKSKSFTSLADVWPSTTTSSSIQDIAKPENAYTRKRKNLGAFKLSNTNTSKKHRTTAFQQSRSFSMVNLHQCNPIPTKIENC